MYISEKYSTLISDCKENYFTPDVKPVFVPSPTGGWNKINPLSSMPASDAVSLVNFVPRPGYVEARGGYNAWAQGLGNGAVESLMAYRPAASSEKLFAAANSKIYDVSSYGVVVDQGLTTSNNRLQYSNFTPAGGASYLVICNGQDPLKNYSNSGGWTTPVITGFNSSLAIHLCNHMRRLWMVEVNSTRVWYLPTDSIAGAATSLDLGPLWQMGSYLTAMYSWNVDGTNGPNSYAVFISNKGQVSIYTGQDPTNANSWNLQGTFSMGSPIGRRCACNYGSDVNIITLQGIVPLSKALPANSSKGEYIAITNKIQQASLEAAQSYSTNFGWEIVMFPKQALLIANVPIVEGNNQQQFVMTTIQDSGPWTLFTGWNANTFEIYNESLYFGDNNGNVNLAYTGATDLFTPIYYDMQCAFNYFDEPGRNKIMSMLRPFIVSNGAITPTLSVNVDFSDNSVSAPVTSFSVTGGVWDIGVWDSATWSGGIVSQTNWLSVNAVGTALSVRMTVNLQGANASNLSLFDSGTFDSMVFDGNGSITESGQNLPILQINAFEGIVQSGATV